MMVCISVLSAGCTESGLLSNDDVPAIAFDVNLDQTKALISPDNLNTAGSKIIVHDVHASGKGLDQYLGGPDAGQYLEFRNGQWSFTETSGGDVIQIPWTKRGIHNFFAYNFYDASASKQIPVGVSYTSYKNNPSYTTANQQTVRIPAEGDWTLTQDNQFDFIYGSASRNVETDGYAPLPMNFKHLFAAVAVEVRNASTQQLKLSSLSFGNIKDKGYAEVNYGGNVQYTLSASKTTGLFPAINNYEETISDGGSAILYTGLGTGQSFLIWPHSAADLSDASISLTYKLGNGSNTTSTVKLTENYTVKTWLAGNKYKYLIAVTDDYISLDVMRVVEWINDDVILEE